MNPKPAVPADENHSRVIFDIEILFLYPWAIAFDKIGVIGMVEMLIFIALFVVGYVYAWKKGALEWD